MVVEGGVIISMDPRLVSVLMQFIKNPFIKKLRNSDKSFNEMEERFEKIYSIETFTVLLQNKLKSYIFGHKNIQLLALISQFETFTS
jgi:hypothetical protein